jgi:hypothetical protein
VRIKKLTVGIRPSLKIFRVVSAWGDIADAIVAALPEKPFRDPEYFTIAARAPQGGLQMRSGNGDRVLTVTSEDVVFIVDRYDSPEAAVNYEAFIEDFEALWSVVNSILDIDSIRRIGIVAEHRIVKMPNPNSKLMAALMRYPVPEYPGRFTCQFEKRRPVSGHEAPDIDSSALINSIYQFYSSDFDVEHPEQGAVNCNLDVQRYYAPTTHGKDVTSNLRKLKPVFDEERHAMRDQLAALGLELK